MATLPPLGQHTAGIGDGLSRNAAIGVLIYGVWLYALMGFKRWAIRILPAMTWLLFTTGLIVSMLPFFLATPIFPATPSWSGGFRVLSA